MKILYVANAFPYPPESGGRMRSFHFLKYLAQKGSVTLVCPANRDSDLGHLPALQDLCEQVIPVDENSFGFRRSAAQESSWRSRLAHLFRQEAWQVQDFYSNELKEHLAALDPTRFDLIFVRYPQMALYLFRSPKLRTVLSKTVVDVDDVTVRALRRKVGRLMPGYERFRQAVNLQFLIRYYRHMNRSAACLVTSEGDRSYLLEKGFARKVFVVPNVIATNGVHGAVASTDTPPVILFCGLLSYPPNEEGILFFCQKILPKIQAAHPQAQLLIVGKNPTHRLMRLGASCGVQVVGRVPSLKPFYEKATLAVVPLLDGAGTRIKILEAMSFRVPVVSTSIGSEGLEVTHGQNILIADDPARFAGHCIELLQSPTKRWALADNAFHLVQNRYSPEVLHQRMDDCLREISRN